MMDINEDELRELIGELDARIDKAGAFVQVEGDEYESGTVVLASKLGYLRLGVEFLKAAYIPVVEAAEDGDMIEVDLPYLFGQASICYTFRRNESVPSRPEVGTASAGDTLAGLFGCGVVLFFLGSLLAGMPIALGAVFNLLAQVIKSIL